MGGGNLPAGAYGLASIRDFLPPLCLEVEYVRSQTETAGIGLQVLDAVIGFTPAAGNTMRNEFIAAPDGKDSWSGAYIADRVRFPWRHTRIRMYVAPDPNHAGRYRYQGVLHNEKGTALIRLDDQPAPGNRKVGLITSELRSRIDLYGIRISAP
jgi:hypothetical protein